MRRRLPRVLALTGALLFSATLLASASARTGAGSDVGWGGFGNTPDENRHSSLTQIGPGNVATLGRLFTVDFQKIDPTVRRGEQSYPVEQNGTLYLTTNDDSVWALNATTGQVKWRYTQNNVAVFRNFGIVANRGVAVCDGHVFVLTLDMTIVQLDAATGQLQRRVAIAQAVPGASMDYGYSETSAPVCFDHRLILGAAGSEYGVRGFVMAFHASDLSPAWPNPFWTIPPAGTEWRRFSTLAGGGVVWTPVSVDPTTDTVYFGTGSATPLYFPSIRPGSDPRADSLIAVNLRTGRMEWWQQLLAFNEWSYDVAQPPLVYDATVGGKRERIVSVATMEGVWYAFDAATGRPIYQRIKVIDRTEHPALQPGKPVAVFPSSLGGLNYSPASFDPVTDDIFNAAAETAGVDVQVKLTPTEKKRKFTLGDVFLGLENGNFGSVLPGWHDHGSISAINVNTGRLVWKFRTPEPERGGVTTTASGVGFAGGGDGVLRAFDLKTGKVLWTFQTGHQIAAGPSLYSVGHKEYLAITVGGTPTSSNGGTAAQLQVFALGGSQAQSPAPLGTTRQIAAPRVEDSVRRSTTRVAVATTGHATLVTPNALVVQPWRADSSNVATVTGRLLLNGVAVRGARVAVGGFVVPHATDAEGKFAYDLDVTVAGRHAIRVVDATDASVNGKPLTPGQQSAVRAATGGFRVGYALLDLSARTKNGRVVVTGRLADTSGAAPPPAHLLTYRLTGTVTNAAGAPVRGAVVVTRTQDRDFWTRSSPTGADGRYSSFFAASDESGADPVPLSVGVALGNVSYGGTVGVNVNFARLKSATMNVQLGSGTSFTVQPPTSYTGAVYAGFVVGVETGGRVVKPLAATWPDADGRFSITLPGSVRGHTLSFWENERQSFSSFVAHPGGPVDLGSWPTGIGTNVPAGLAFLRAS